MKKKSIWIYILSGFMLCFLIYSNATASPRVETTLAWHNLSDDFYFVVENSDTVFHDEDVVKKGKLKKSKLDSRYQIDENAFHPEYSVWKVDTSNSFEKKINKKIKKALKSAAKKQQIALTGKKKNWKKEVFKPWNNQWKEGDEGLWTLYNENDLIQDSFIKLETKKIKGKIGKVKFIASLDIFTNSLEDAIASAAVPDIPVSTHGGSVTGGGGGGGGGWNSYANPEPATVLLFGFGLLGIAGVSRRKE